MLKRTITFTDYNDIKRTEDFYFNLSQPEVLEMENSVEGGLQGILQRISATTENIGLVAEFKRLLLASIGERTGDGRFIKSAHIRENFESSAAYPVFFMELATDSDVAAAFVESVLPAGMVAETPKQTNDATRMLADAQAALDVRDISKFAPPPPPGAIANDIAEKFKTPEA